MNTVTNSVLSVWTGYCCIAAEKTFAFFVRREPDFTDAFVVLLLVGLYFLLSGGVLGTGIIWLIWEICRICF